VEVAELAEAEGEAGAGLGGSGVQPGPEGEQTPLVHGGGLRAHENAGGHVLARHVDLSDPDLLQRLARNGLFTFRVTRRSKLTLEGADLRRAGRKPRHEAEGHR
jgi:hypothetical protein